MAEVAGQWYRVSSDAQDEENQRQGVTGLISARGYARGPEYVAHDKSASKREHLDLLNEAIEDMRAGRINVLVMRHTDRIDRTEDLGDILKRVKAVGGRIESVTEPWLEDVASLGGKVMTSVTEYMNAEYTRKLSKNVKDAHARGRRDGYLTGSIPFGYASEGETGKKRLVLDPVNADLARAAFQKASEGQSASAIAAWLDEVAPQVIKKTGKRSPWRAKRVLDMIKRDLYWTGFRDGHAFEALVSEETWKRANAALASRSFTTGGRRGVHGYSGVALCECGSSLYFHQSTRGGKPVGVPKYRCSKGRRGIGGEETCGRPGLPFDAANDAIDAEMSEAHIPMWIMETTGGDFERQRQIEALEAEMDAARKAKDRAAQRDLLDRIEALEAMPSTPVVTRPVRSGRTVADAWASGTLTDRRSLLADYHVTALMSPEGKVRARLEDWE